MPHTKATPRRKNVDDVSVLRRVSRVHTNSADNRPMQNSARAAHLRTDVHELLRQAEQRRQAAVAERAQRLDASAVPVYSAIQAREARKKHDLGVELQHVEMEIANHRKAMERLANTPGRTRATVAELAQAKRDLENARNERRRIYYNLSDFRPGGSDHYTLKSAGEVSQYERTYGRQGTPPS